jgi:hypothetical protein
MAYAGGYYSHCGNVFAWEGICGIGDQETCLEMISYAVSELCRN